MKPHIKNRGNLRVFAWTHWAPLAALLLVVWGVTTARAQTDTNLITDNFSGTNGTAVNSSGRILVNPAVPANIVWSSVTGSPILTGSNQAQLNGVGTFRDTSVTGTPTASFGDTNPSHYYIQLTIANLNVLSTPGGFDLSIGTGSNAVTLDTANPGLTGQPVGVFIGNGSVNQAYGLSGIAGTGAAESGTWVIDWYTNRVILSQNGTTVFDSSVNAPPVWQQSGGTPTAWQGIPSGALGVQMQSQGDNIEIGGLSYDEIGAVPEPSVLALAGAISAAFLLVKFGKRKFASK